MTQNNQSALDLKLANEGDFTFERNLVDGASVTENYKAYYNIIKENNYGIDEWKVRISAGAATVTEAVTTFGGTALYYTETKAIFKALNKLFPSMPESAEEVLTVHTGIEGNIYRKINVAGDTNGVNMAMKIANIFEGNRRKDEVASTNLPASIKEIKTVDIYNTNPSDESDPGVVIATVKSGNKTKITVSDKTKVLSSRGESDTLLKLLAKEMDNGDVITFDDKKYIKSTKTAELTIKDVDPKANFLGNTDDLPLGDNKYLLPRRRRS
jgi:hypothetical protein